MIATYEGGLMDGKVANVTPRSGVVRIPLYTPDYKKQTGELVVAVGKGRLVLRKDT